MKNLLIFFVVFLFTVSGYSLQTDKEFNEKLASYINNVMSAYEIPGVAIGVVKDGEISFKGGFGVKNIDSKEPVTEFSIFHMASVSKPFVATAVMQLIEAGKVDPDLPVVNYIPYFRTADPRTRDITVRQMLVHTSGMPDVRDYEWGKEEDPAGALTRYTRSLTDQELIGVPGEKWAYSNMAFEVLGNLIENVSGQSFENYIRQNILQPAGMIQSSFLIDPTYQRLYADPHIRRLNIQVSPVYPYNPMHAPSSTLHSNVVDMCRWAIINLNRGVYNNRRILKAASYNSLWKPYSRAYGDLRQGLSWFIGNQHGQMVVQHGGGDVGFSTYFSMMPRRMMAVVVLTNHDYSPVKAISDAVWAMLMNEKPQMPKIPVLITMSKVIQSDNVAKAIQTYHELRANQADKYNFGEAQLNILGYALLQQERIADAIEIFKLNVAAFPEAFNPYDSLGEAYMIAGEKELAIRNYEKSIELNPDNSNGIEMLKKLKGESVQ